MGRLEKRRGASVHQVCWWRSDEENGLGFGRNLPAGSYRCPAIENPVQRRLLVLAFGWQEAAVMGDEELNFTDEEARCWADDPRNQAQEDRVFLRAIVVCLLLIVVFVVLALLASVRSSRPAAEQNPIGCVLVLRGQAQA